MNTLITRNSNGNILDIKKINNPKFDIKVNTQQMRNGIGNVLNQINFNQEINITTDSLEELSSQDYIDLLNDSEAKSTIIENRNKEQEDKINGLLSCFCDECSVDKLKGYDTVLYNKFIQKYNYCVKCKKYVEIKEVEDEIYNKRTDDIYLEIWETCSECGYVFK